MKTFKLIIKGILLYLTAFLVCFTIAGIDSIIANKYLAATLGIDIFFITLCAKFLSVQDIRNVTIWKDIDSNFR